MKRILIVGAGSYIGTSFEQYLKYCNDDSKEDKTSLRYFSHTLSSVNLEPAVEQFKGYEVAFYVAGIAHRREKKKNGSLYYKVNRDLAIKVAETAKEAGVKQFILLSSMSVYGMLTGHITKTTKANPVNHYGKSKWQADNIIWKLRGENFKVAVLRPPMVYGKGCKGNYQLLRKLALWSPVFLDVKNERSMIYIENLCEFVKRIIDGEQEGLFFPQNSEYVCTSTMVKSITDLHGKKIKMVKIPDKLACAIPVNILKKVFGNLTYEMSEPVDRLCFEESILRTEKIGGIERKKTILIFSNEHSWTYNLRKEIVEALLNHDYRVVLALPYGEKIEQLKEMGSEFADVKMLERHGMNPLKEIRLFSEYKKIISKIKPDVVLTYTIKPNLYGGVAAKQAGVPFIANITGLGGAIKGGKSKVKSRLILKLYKFGLNQAHMVFFQNSENCDFMVSKGVVTGPHDILPGSGVNLERHCMEEYPNNCGELVFTTIGRIMKDKGIDELLRATAKIKKKYPNVRFRLIGFFDDEYQEKIEEAVSEGIIEYLGRQDDIHSFIKESHAVIHPSYHEGMSNVLLEAAATGRPVLASQIPGCQETFVEGVSGIGFKAKNSKDLERAIEQFINLPYEKKAAMGSEGRKWVKRFFDRQIVVEKYLEEIQSILGANIK